MEFINFVSDKVIDLKMDCKTKEDFFKDYDFEQQPSKD